MKRSRLLLEAVLLVTCVWWSMARLPVDTMKDFFQFWSVRGLVQRADVSNVYAPGVDVLARSEVAANPSVGPLLRIAGSAVASGYTATPLLYAMVASACRSDFDTDYRHYRLASIALFMVSVFLLARVFRIPRPWLFLIAPVLVAADRPLRADILLGNVGELHLAFVAALTAVLMEGKSLHPMLAGAIAALSVAFKPTTAVAFVALAAVLFMDDRKLALHFAVGALIGAAIAAIWPALMFGSRCTWSAWLHRSGGLRGVQSRNLFSYILPSMTTAPMGLVSGVGAIVIVAAGALRRAPTRFRYAAVFQAGVAAFLLAAPFIYAHHFLLLMPAGFYFVTRPVRRWASVEGVSKALGCLAVPLNLAVGFPRDPLWMKIGLAGALSTFIALVLDLAAGTESGPADHESRAPGSPEPVGPVGRN